jgi:hypothetical protein
MSAILITAPDEKGLKNALEKFVLILDGFEERSLHVQKQE